MSNAPSKWRPSLGMVTAGMISVVLVVAIGGFAIVRFNVAQPAGAEILTASMLALLAAFAIGIVFVRAISRPLRELVQRAELITHGDNTAIGPLERHGTRELAALSDAFMRMAQSLSDRTTYVRTFSRHVSHEMKTPLTAIRGAAELVLDGSETMAPADRRRFMQNIIADVERMTHLLDRLHEQARAETPGAAGVARLSEVVTALRARFYDLSISVSGDADTEVAMTAENVLVVLDNLASNAREHGAKSLNLEIAPRSDVVVLHLQDDGAGINPGNRDRIFDPFFTTRRENGGTGMGLTIARAMLEAHGGAIEAVESAIGARFELRVPSAPQSLHKNS